MKTLIIGDVHGDWPSLNTLINKKKPDIILQCGDFGFWPRLEEIRPLDQIKSWGTKIYFCDGNHEDHEELQKLENNEVAPRIFYMKRGSVLELGGNKILFMGGATSVDRAERVPGHDWFPQESITQRDINETVEKVKEIDMVISHTCPREFEIPASYKDDGYYNDPSRDALSFILGHYQPKAWFFGHWHMLLKGQYKNCNWMGLNKSKSPGWWVEADFFSK